MNSIHALLRTIKAYVVAIRAIEINEDYDDNALSFRIGNSIYAVRITRIKDKKPDVNEEIIS